MARLPKGTSQGVTRKVYAKAYDLAHPEGVPKVSGGASVSSKRDYAKGSSKSADYKTVNWRNDFDEPQITGLDTGLSGRRRRK